MKPTGFKAIFVRSVLQIVRRPIYWAAFFILPLFCFLFLSDLMTDGLPSKVLKAAMVDKDGSSLSRSVTQQARRNADGGSRGELQQLYRGTP